MRDRLIELIREAKKHTSNANSDIERNMIFADYLLENGVVALPCKLGDVVYRISTRTGTRIKYIQETTVSRIAIDNEGIWLFCACNPIAKCVFGKTAFLTREDAEKALKEGASDE